MTTTTTKKPAAPRTAKPADDTPARDPRWEALTAPFPADWIEKLPKQVRRGDEDRDRCEDTPRGRRVSADGHFCGGWHARSVHLDYVGHAGITMRLNDAVGPENWEWEPMATSPEGLPLMGREFWIRLTILGVTKYGVGDDYRSGKEAIGDALRNAAMRFGIGTYLWSKSDMAHNLATFAEPDPDPEPPQQGTRQQGPTKTAEAAPAAQGEELPARPAGMDPAVVKAETIAACKADNLDALREVWDRVCASGAVHAQIPDPDGPGETWCTLGEFITRRRSTLAA